MTEADPVLARRAAVAAISREAAEGVIDRLVSEASRALSTIGLGREAAKRYGDGIRNNLPIFYEAMQLPDGSERDAKLAMLVAQTRGVSEHHHIPRLIERGLVAIAVRLGREVLRRRAAQRGFTPEELEREFVAFTDLLEDRLFEDRAGGDRR